MSSGSKLRLGENGDGQRLEALIADYIRACEAGTPPDRRQMTERHPEFAQELRQFFAQRDRLNQLAQPIRGFGEALAGAVGPGRQVSYVGDYELLEEIARGGMGIVYKARQKTLGRIVAVKMIVSGRLATEEDVKRFHIEAQAAAGLMHANIVSIHEVGQHEGWHYFSMDYIAGRDLAAILRDNPLPARQAATYVRQMAEAIHYAHQQGTLHRDLKPSNVLVDSHNQIHITDFGLAAPVEGASDLTRTGQILGTPSYLPPEQAQGQRSLIGPASDVYSLGAVLYECLTGRPPFRAETAVETLRQVLHEEPAAPRVLNPKTPHDLETICLKCLDKESRHRYPSARHLAEDLGRYLADEPIHARPISVPARLWRWGRRNPLVATLTGAAAVLLMAVAAVSSLAYVREAKMSGEIVRAYGDVTQLRGEAAGLQTDVRTAERELQQAQGRTASLEHDFGELEVQRQSLAATLEVRQQKLYATLLYLARADWEAGEILRADAYLEDCPVDLRDRRWGRLKHLCHPAMRPFPGNRCLAISPDGRQLASVRDRVVADAGRWEIVVSDFQTEQIIGSIPSQTAIHALAFSPDGALLISGGEDAVIHIWDVKSGELRHSLSGHTAPIWSLSLCADGSLLASASLRELPRGAEVGEVLLWDLQTREVARQLPGLARVALDPAGKRIAYRTSEQQGNFRTSKVVRIESVDAASDAGGEQAFKIAAAYSHSAGCAFSPDGSLLALGGNGVVEIWNLDEKQRVFQFHVYASGSLAFSSDGTRIAYAVRGDKGIRGRSDDSTVVWNLHTGEREQILPWYQSRVSAIAFTPDGLSLATTDEQSVKVWDVAPSVNPTEAILADIRQLNVGPFDWPQWGGSRCRVNTPAGKNIPSTWDPGSFDRKSGAWLKEGARNIKWVAPLGSQTYGNPVVANGKIFVGTNNGNGYLKRYPSEVDLGVLLCFKEQTGEFLWQHSNEKLPTGRVHDWPLQGVCSTPAVDGDRLWYVSNRGEVVCLDTEGFDDGEDDGPVRAVQTRLFEVTANLGLLAAPGAEPASAIDEQTIRFFLNVLRTPPSYYSALQKGTAANEWSFVRFEREGTRTLLRLTIEQGELRAWNTTPGQTSEMVGPIALDLVSGLNDGKIGPQLHLLFASKGFDLPAGLQVETIQADTSWRVITSEAMGKQEFKLERAGTTLRCETPVALLKHEADVVWSLDMMKQLGVSQHNMSNCSPLIVEDYLFVCTSNGVDESHTTIPAPNAPSFICLNRWTGQVLWTDKSPGLNILHSQWASPSYGVFDGQPQVIFPGGDGWVYSFDPRGDGQGHSKLLWKFDGNFKESKYILGGRGARNEIIAFPAIYDGLVYIVMGQDPEHGEGEGCLWCLDPAKHKDGSDVSESMAVDLNGQVIPHKRLQAIEAQLGERAIPNPNSAIVWRYTAQDRNGDGVIVFDEQFHRSLSIPVIKDDILYVADFSGLFHCLNAKTGKAYWTYDMLGACWSTALVVDGKVYIGDEDGDVAIFRHSADPTKAMRKERGEQKPWYDEINMLNSVYMTPIVANNVLYIANKTHLFAIEQE